MANRKSSRRWVFIALIVAAIVALWALHQARTALSKTDGFANSRHGQSAQPGVAGDANSVQHPLREPSLIRRHQPAGDIKPPLPAPLPPAGTRVADVLAALREAANHGDVRAACRVGLELARCYRQRSTMQTMQTYYDDAVAQHASADEIAARLGSLESYKSDSASDATMCGGVEPVDANEAWSYVLQAASGGNAAAAAYLVNAPPTQPFAVDSQVLDLWAEHRDEFVDMGIRAGDVYTLFDAYFMASSGRGWGGNSRSFPKDPYRAIEYGAALLPFARPQDADQIHQYIEQQAQSLSEEQVTAATHAGDTLRLQYFSIAIPVENLHRVGTLRPERCASSE